MELEYSEGEMAWWRKHRKIEWYVGRGEENTDIDEVGPNRYEEYHRNSKRKKIEVKKTH